MLKGFVAITEEIDEIDVAVSEILEQINPEKNLLKNSVGLLSCYAEFIESGVVEALCAALPFDIIGTTTCMTAIQNHMTPLGLSLCVLTGDDVSFQTVLSGQISDGSTEPFEAGYRKACESLDGDLKLIVSYVPLMMNVGGDMFVDIFNRVSGGVPLFGAISVDHTEDYHLANVLYNGQAYPDRAAYVLIAGEVTPKFSVVTLSPEKIGHDNFIVTKSQGPQLIEVDGKPAVDFFKNAGFIAADGTFQNAMNAYPLIVEHEGASEPVLCVAFAMTPDGTAACGANIPVGASISIGNIDADEVVKSTQRVLSQVIEENNYSYLLMFACVGRFFCLGLDLTREAQAVENVIKKVNIPYGLTYVGGELCPLPSKGDDETYNNINHNDSFIICGF